MEPNLPYATPQQLSPWRAGTPGRAPRNWQAVVDKGRPLCFSSRHLLAAIVCLGLFSPAPLAAQLFPSGPSLQIRLGGFYSTPLVSDAVSSRAVDDSIPGVRSDEVTIRQRPGPIGSLALRVPLRPTTQLEISASVGRSTVRGDDSLESWEVASATVGTVVLGFGYLYRQIVALRGGIGMTKLFTEERGMFAEGNSIKPLLEGGAGTAVRLGGFPLELDVRVQTHSFETATLRDNGGSGGNVLRAVVQVGTTLWGAK